MRNLDNSMVSGPMTPWCLVKASGLLWKKSIGIGERIFVAYGQQIIKPQRISHPWGWQSDLLWNLKRFILMLQHYPETNTPVKWLCWHTLHNFWK
ncbi:hypothetical protein P8452_66813 [Trifolium repens]|nr:hypothetical protein P8452_66813 [Trifolium repens]